MSDKLAGPDDCQRCCNSHACGCYGECINEAHWAPLGPHNKAGITSAIKEGDMQTIEIEMPGTDEITDRAAAQLAQHLHERMGEQVCTTAMERLIATIDKEVGGIVAANVCATVRPVNEFGEPTGKEKTVKELIAERVTAFLTERVTADGKLSDGYYNRDLRTRTEWAIARAIEGEVTKQIADAVTKAANDTKAQILGGVKDMVSQTVARILKLPVQ